MKYKALGIAVCLAALLPLASCRLPAVTHTVIQFDPGTTETVTVYANNPSPTTNTPASTVAASTQPALVKTWAGGDNLTTEPFTITKQPWKVVYTFTPDPPISGDVYANLFIVEAMKPGQSLPASVVSSIAGAKAPVSQESYIYETGTFYLAVTASNGTWSASVYQ